MTYLSYIFPFNELTDSQLRSILYTDTLPLDYYCNILFDASSIVDSHDENYDPDFNLLDNRFLDQISSLY